MNAPRGFTLFSATVALTLVTAPRISFAERPLDVGSRAQVFIDKALVGSAEGVTFTLHPARTRNNAGGPWLWHQKEPRPASPMVIYDEQERRFKSWVSSSYNTSKDGLVWEKLQANDESWRYIVRVSAIKDPRAAAPAERYKFLTFGPNRPFPPGMKDADSVTTPDGAQTLFWHLLGYNTCISADGRTLAHLSRQSLLPRSPDKTAKFTAGDMLHGFYDKRTGLFVAFLKASWSETKFSKRRSFVAMTSKDFETWSEPTPALVSDEADDDAVLSRLDTVRPLLDNPIDPKYAHAEVYGVGGSYSQESCTIVLPWLILVSNLSHNGKSQDGPSEVQLAVSRDLVKWDRPFRQAAIPRGRVALEHPDRSDAAYANSQWDSCWFNHVGPGLDVGDEVWFYYSAYNTPHGHPHTFGNSPPGTLGQLYHKGTGLAVWKRDRFVSVDAQAARGVLTTKPLSFTGNRLELNAVTKPDGGVVVDLLDQAGRILVRSRSFSGDEVRHRVQWQTPVELANWERAAVALRFHLKNAELYAFAFRD